MFARLSLPPAAALVVAIAACGDSTAPGAAHRVSLSFATNTAAAGGQIAGATVGANGDIGVVIGSDELIISRAELVLREIEFEREDSLAGCIGSNDACEKVEAGPFLVDLPLNGSLGGQLSATVPPGTFDEIEFELERVRGDSAPERAFRQAHPDLDGLSVRVQGTFNGEPFTFVSSVSAELEIELDPPLVVGESGHNVTISVDLARWFQRSGGGLIDPRTANPGQPNAEMVASNIRSSFDAFDDDDRDGHDDDDDHSGRGRGGDDS